MPRVTETLPAPQGTRCHAPAIFRNTMGSDGKPLVDGRAVTGFGNEEEDAVGLTGLVPFLVEDMLKAKGGRHASKEAFAEHVITDGKLMTGQNPASSEAAASALLSLLGHDWPIVTERVCPCCKLTAGLPQGLSGPWGRRWAPRPYAGVTLCLRPA